MANQMSHPPPLPELESYTPYERFAYWEATPPDERVPPTLTALAETLGVHRRTLVRWRREPHFQKMFQPLLRDTAAAALKDAILAVTRLASAGSEKHVRLLLQLTQTYGFEPPGTEKEQPPIVVQVWAPSKAIETDETADAEVKELPARTVEGTE